MEAIGSTAASPNVLLVEDEESYVEALALGLRREGFEVRVARDGAEALVVFDAMEPDVVLLDVMLPRVSGIEVCREIRKRSKVPVVLVTAKATELDIVVGLEVGADDYITKPYRLRELVARLRAVLRRVSTVSPEPSSPVAMSFQGVTIDAERHEVTVDGRPVTMPLKEFEILERLMTSAGRVVRREVLMDDVWGLDYVGDTKTLDVHIKRLRSKIEHDPAAPQRITTIRGVGYRYERDRPPTAGAV